MPRYAKTTEVPVERSRAEIEETLRRYGASEFHSGWMPDRAMIAFRIGGLLIRFVLPIPASSEDRFVWRVNGRTKRKERQTENNAYRAWDQEIRQRWRALLLVVKAKLEAVECGISTIEQEFLAFIVLPDDTLLCEWFAKEAMVAIKSGQMPRLGMRQDVEDAEFTESKVDRTRQPG